ncbi:hypothetical protein [Qipengyuania zhejiangensis]|jgi:hypothetical protein|uniref:hypothetical protein n=1 Tax=Qipengyuania zhejiangensis TaxID=3077782 RepID=UPI002D7680D0|nr:hypothetical protein [Qipengyuania sp. Z2]MCL4671586.1 hypothetical protein [Sphingomonadaceae bacterium]
MLDENSVAALSEGPGAAKQPLDCTNTSSEPSGPAQPEHSDMEFPAWIWAVMFAGYGVFFVCMILATGNDLHALFAIIVSIGYTVIYFAAASILVGLKPSRRRSDFARGVAPLQTYTGPMSMKAVFGQVLVIPICLALFGFAVVIIRAIVF